MPGESIKVKVDAVTKTFPGPGGPVTAVANAEFQVREGEFLVILGPSGCGKSTILRIIAGLEPATTGTVFVDGARVNGTSRDRGMVFQSYTSFPWQSVTRNIGFGLELRGVSSSERKSMVDHYLDVTGLRDFKDRFPGELSGGMQQRVAIARTMANRPEVLLMDEPFGALDAQTRWEMQELLLNVWSETKITVIFVTHDVEEAVFLADRIYISTARPSRLKAEIQVPFPRPRHSKIKATDEFSSLERRVVSLIRKESLKPEDGP